jgi:hypothetical protein
VGGGGFSLKGVFAFFSPAAALLGPAERRDTYQI